MASIGSSNSMTSGSIVMICSAGCWGSATVMSKAVLGQIPPVSLLVLQLLASISFLWGILFALKWGGYLSFRVRLSDFRWAVSGVLEPGLAYLLTLLGLRHVSASQAGLIVTTEPIMVMFLASWLLHEKVTPRFFGLSVLALLGVALTVEWAPGLNDQVVNSNFSGVLLVFLGTIAAALYVVLSKRSASQHDALYLAALQQTCGLVFVCLMWPYFWDNGEADLLGLIDSKTLAWAVISGVVQYALAFWAYLVAVRRMPVSQATVFLNLIPLFTLSGAALFLNEHLSLSQWSGAAIILLAIGLLKERASTGRLAGEVSLLESRV